MNEADEFKDLIFKRTGIKADELVCPREKSAMTPCVARDGGLAEATHSIHGTQICVGCESSIKILLEIEKLKHVTKID